MVRKVITICFIETAESGDIMFQQMVRNCGNIGMQSAVNQGACRSGER